MKTQLTLVIGDKNLSSWSMRPWLALKASGLPFREVRIALDTPKTRARIAHHSPSGKVPVLQIRGAGRPSLHVWDSLAICETIAELAPRVNLWPSNPLARARARAYAAEMHSGFSSLRTQLSMDIKLRMKVKHLLPQTVADIRRVHAIWKEALGRSDGPFLFGEFGIVDAFYAPVVMRFVSYGIETRDKTIVRYMEDIQTQPFVKAWVKSARRENPRYALF
ncbi:MAG: glutathione S-transferase family protein [Bacteriovoracia bacterium]